MSDETLKLLQSLAQWPVVAAMFWGFVKFYNRTEIKLDTQEAKHDAEMKALKDECAAERVASAAKHEALLRELLAQQTAVRDRELERTTKHIADNQSAVSSLTVSVATQTRSITDMTQAVVTQTAALVDQTEAIRSRKSMQLPAVK